MPASEVMSLYRQHKLHSGPGGPVVKKKKQAVAIQISMARKEGHHIPEVKGSYQQGGQVPESGNYKVHQGEEVFPSGMNPVKPRQPSSGKVAPAGFGDATQKKPQGEPDRRSLIDPVTGEWPGTVEKGSFAPQRGEIVPQFMADRPSSWGSPAHYHLEGDVWHPELKHRPKSVSPPDVKGSFQQGGLVPETGNYLVHGGEEVARRNQARDIAARTNQAQHDEWNRAMHQKEDFGGAMERGRPSEAFGTPPQPRDIPPAGNDPHYAVAGLRGNVAQRMHEQGERAAGLVKSFQEGGAVQSTGNYEAHAGEQLVPAQGGDDVYHPTPGKRQTNAPAPGGVSPQPGEGTPSTGVASKIAAAYGIPAGGAADKLGSFLKGGGKMTQYNEARSAVAAPLARSASNFDAPAASFKRGGTIPRTGIYRLHAGEHVIPKSLAGRYREMKEHG